MARRTAIIRFSNAVWIGESSGPFSDVLRARWLTFLESQTWQGFDETTADKLLAALLDRAKRSEFRHFPPFRIERRRLQGGGDGGFTKAAGAPEPRFLPLRVVALGKLFKVHGAGDFHVTGRIRGQLFLSGYLIIDLEFNVDAEEALMASGHFWRLVRLLSPNESSSPVMFEKPGLTAAPKAFAQALVDGATHSLVQRGGASLALKQPWHVGIVAERGPWSAPPEVVGHNAQKMRDFGFSDLVAGERGYYYIEHQRTRGDKIARRFITLRMIFDFARYHKDCLVWASEAAKQWREPLAQAALAGGIARASVDVGQAAQFAMQLRDFIGALDRVSSSTSSFTTRWQRRIYTLFSEPMRVSTAHDKYDKHIAALAQEVGGLRGSATSAQMETATARGYDVFISYAREEYVRIGPIKERLEQLGLDLFVDIDGGLEVGAQWMPRLGAALDNSKVVLGCWTSVSLTREVVHLECNKAMSGGKLVPVLLEDVGDKLGRGLVGAVHAERLIDAQGNWSTLAWANVCGRLAQQIDGWAARFPDHPDAAQAREKARALRGVA